MLWMVFYQIFKVLCYLQTEKFWVVVLGKFNLKISIIPNRLEKYMSFTINNKLSFIDSFQFLSSSIDSFVKNLNKDDFK